MLEVGGGFLRPLFTRFRRSLDDFDGKWKSDLVDELEDLQEYLQSTFGWDLDGVYLKRGLLELEDGELGDFAPTVVELTPEQLKLMGASDVGGHANGSIGEDSEEEADLDDMDTRF